MKKSCLLLSLVLLGGCASTGPAENLSSPTANDVTIETTPDTERVADNKKERPSGHIAHCDYQTVQTTDNTQMWVEIIEGELVLEYLEEGKQVVIEDLPPLKSMAWHTNCGGDDDFALLSEEGEIFYLQLPPWSENMAEQVKQNLRAIPTEEKIISLGVYDDSSPLTTCGGDTFYANTESGKLLAILPTAIATKPRSELHPYKAWIEIIDPFDSEGNLQENLILFVFEDGTLHRGKIENEKLVWEEKALVAEDQKELRIEQGYIVTGNTNSGRMIYLIDEDQYLYTIDVWFEKFDLEARLEIQAFDPTQTVKKIVEEQEEGTDLLRSVEFIFGTGAIIRLKIDGKNIKKMREPGLLS